MANRLYIGNVPWTATEGDLRNFFSQYGVTEVKIVTDRETGKSRGFAFVEVEANADDVIAALNGVSLGNRALRVSHALEKSKAPATREDVKRFGAALHNRR